MGRTLLSTIRDLQRRRGRERRGLALAEGVRLVEEALAAAVPIRGAVVAPALEATSRGKALKAALLRAGVPLESLGDRTLAALADTEHPQGVIAVVEPPRRTLEDIRPGPRGAVLVLDAVQDPGNVGALVRTALGLGAAGLVALPGTADLSNPKALRGSMGALFRLPCAAADVPALLGWAARSGVAIWTSGVDGSPVGSVRRRGPVALVVGNEGAGVHPALARAADATVAVPLAGPVESLNVAVAAGILLYEVLRDR
ncbi:MAG TPA: RNA methyltransferase [Gemmatimonadales bacterium]|nr:RNA methyltransferase [Gemmatimonadales bacterium]